MGFINKYPYTDFHELNLDWILDRVKELDNTVTDFTVFNKLTWAGEWSAAKSYVRWSIVQDENGNGYISTQPVPLNVPLTNTDYWQQIAKYEELYTAFNQRIAQNASDISKNKTSIAKNASDISANKNAIAKNTSDISANKDAIAKNTSDINELKIPQRIIPTGILIGHRGCSYAPENTEESYICGLTAGYDGIEGDLNYTSDGYLVMIHDNYIDRTSNGTGNIRDMTWSQAQKFNYNKTYPSFKKGTICRLKKFLHLAKVYGKIAEIDIANRNLPQNILNDAVSIVEDMGMVNNVIFACDPQNYKTILNRNKNCSISISVTALSDATITSIYNEVKKLTERYVLSFDISSFDDKYYNSGMPLKLWTINNTSTVLDDFNSNVLEIITDNAKVTKPTGPYHISSYGSRIDDTSTRFYALSMGQSVLLIGNVSTALQIDASTGSGRTIGQCDFPCTDYRAGTGIGFSSNGDIFGVTVQSDGHINIFNKDTLPKGSLLYLSITLPNTYMNNIWG